MLPSLVLLLSIIATAQAVPLQDTLDNRLFWQTEDALPVSTEEIVATKEEAKPTKKSSGRFNNDVKTWKSNLLTSFLSQDERTENKSNTTRFQKLTNETKEKILKKPRKHKAIFVNYPLIPQIQYSNVPSYDVDYTDDYNANVEPRTPGGSNRYQESNIFYIRLPPTPYMFVPGLGYISQPPTYSTANLRPQIPYVRPTRPKPVYQTVNPFIKLPIDFVSNGKPTSVYQWQKKPSKKPTDSPITNLDSLSAEFVSNGKPTSIYQWQTNLKPVKRPDDLVNSLDKGPYTFNGKPTSFFILKPDGTSSGHQNIRYADYKGQNSYY